MTQYTLKNACMIVMILLAGIALSPSWAGGENYQAKIKIIGDDFELDEFDVSGLGVGGSMSFYTNEGREVLVTREDDGFDISIDGESLDIPRFAGGAHLAGGHHGVKVITREFVCDSDEECDHEFINIHEDADIHFLDIAGDELALDIEILHELQCDNVEECDHDVMIWREDGDWDSELEDGALLDFSEDDGHRVIIIKKRIHKDAGEEI